MIEKWSDLVVNYRKTVICLSVLFLLGMSVGVKNIYFESSTDIWFLENDPVLIQYDTLKDRFGSDDYLVVGVQVGEDSEDLLNKASMATIQKITDFMEEHIAVNKVRSLSKFEYIHYVDGLLAVDDIVPEESDNFELSESQWSNMRTVLKREFLAHDLLYTPDLKSTIISARIVRQEEYNSPNEAKIDFAMDFQKFIEKEGIDSGNVKLHLSGSAMISESFFRFSMTDQSISYPLMVTLIIIFLLLIFRTWIGMLLPFGIMLMSTVISLGAIGYLGWAMNMLNVVIPSILMVVALGGSIHILMGFYKYRNQGASPADAAKQSLIKYLKPCFYASLTTSVGFMALTSSKLAPVVELGYVMVVGVMTAFIFTVGFLPAILCYVNGKPTNTTRLAETGVIARVIKAWPEKVFRARKGILIATGCLIIPLLYFCSQLVVDTNFVRNFKEDTPIRNGLSYFDEKYKGALTLEFMLDSGVEDGIKEPAFMQRALDFQNYVISTAGTGRANSMLNYLMKINQVMNDDNPEYFKIPATRDMVGQYLFLYSSSSPDEDLTDLMTFDGRYMRISVFFEVAPSNLTKARVGEIENHIAENFSDLNIETSGRAVLFNNMDNYVLEGLTSSFSIAILIIGLCFFLLFKSIRFGLYALVPNITPILVAGAVMGFMGIYLDFATLVVAAATLGIAVDDTVHFMTIYVSEKRAGEEHKEAVTRAIHESGSAIVSTTIILIIGFSSLAISSFVPNILLGVLGCVVILFALIGDMVVLPAIVMSRFSSKEKAVSVDGLGAGKPQLDTATE